MKNYFAKLHFNTKQGGLKIQITQKKGIKKLGPFLLCF